MQNANSILINKKILIIDDDQFSVLLTKLKLRNYCDPLNITALNSTCDAIAYLEETEKNKPAMMPDLILLETSIEEGKGWDFITYFQMWGEGTHHRIKLVILTSSQFFSDFRRSTSFMCVFGFLTKPLQTDLLLKMLESPAETTVVNSIALVNSIID